MLPLYVSTYVLFPGSPHAVPKASNTYNMTNPVNESAYMELRRDYLSATLLSAVVASAVVGTHNEVSVIMMSTSTEHELINYYRTRKVYIMLISNSLLAHQLLLHLLNQ